MAIKLYPAHGWLPVGAHLKFERDDQGKDFITNWRGVIQAPGAGECIAVPANTPFPDGFGPAYPVVRIDAGDWAERTIYLGHTTSTVTPGERFAFGHPLARADQGHDIAGIAGPVGWVELGTWIPGVGPGPLSSTHDFDAMLATPLRVRVPDKPLKYGDWGPNVWLFTWRLSKLGYLPHSTFHFSERVHGAVVLFKKRHHLPIVPPDGGAVDARVWITIRHAWDRFRKTGKREVP